MRPGPQLKYIQVEQICHEPALVPARVYAEYVRLTFLQIREMAGRASTSTYWDFVSQTKLGSCVPKICVCAAGGNMLVWYILKSVKCIDIGCVQACSPVQTTRVCISTHVMTCVQAPAIRMYVCVRLHLIGLSTNKRMRVCICVFMQVHKQMYVYLCVCKQIYV
jgi:hypothetical protein